MRGQMTVGIMAAFRSTGARQHFETLQGIVPGLIIVRVAPFCRTLGTFHRQLRRHRDIVTAKQNIESTYVDGSPEDFCSLVPARVQQ